MKQLWTTKSMQDLVADSDACNLNRSLGTLALTAIGIGAIIGTGIFVLTGLAAAQYAGPGIVLSFVVAGLGCAFAGLCYAEFAAMVPVSGSAYSYSYATLGEFIAWFVGWNLVLEYLFAASTVAVGWSRYLGKLLGDFGITIPDALSHAPFAVGSDGASLVVSGGLIDLPAMLIVCALTTLCYIGIRQSASVNSAIVILKVTILLVVITAGAFYVTAAYWHPFLPPNTGTFGEYGWSGVLRGAAVVFFAYIGFDAVSCASQEARDPSRTVPRGILLSLTLCTVIYIAMGAVLTGLVPYKALNDAAPVAVALDAHEGLRWLKVPVILGALLGLTSTIIVMLIAQSRIFMSMARDGLLPSAFSRVHAKFRTPHVATLVTGIAAAIIAGAVPIQLLGQLVSIGTLVAFIVVCVGVLVLRHTRPDLARPFRVRAPWLVCTLGVVFCAVMALSLPHDTWLRLAVWTVIGVVVYFAYGRKHSRLAPARAAAAPGRK
jgi:basic amino acid/polyamine antiporter, APA family